MSFSATRAYRDHKKRGFWECKDNSGGKSRRHKDSVTSRDNDSIESTDTDSETIKVFSKSGKQRPTLEHDRERGVVLAKHSSRRAKWARGYVGHPENVSLKKSKFKPADRVKDQYLGHESGLEFNLESSRRGVGFDAMNI